MIRPSVLKWLLCCSLLLLFSCCLLLVFDKQPETKYKKSIPQLTTVVMNKMTPVKNQGIDSYCWIYAMLSAIETEHLMQGDSVHLSPVFVMRSLMDDAYVQGCLSGGRREMSCRGMGITAVHLIERHGIVPYDSYHEMNAPASDVVLQKIRQIVRAVSATRCGLQPYRSQVDNILDHTYGYLPHKVFFYGVEYTFGEFGRSVCSPGEYIGITSFAHHPFGTCFSLEIPDNLENNQLLNIPIDSLVHVTVRAVTQGHGVCWEGDITEHGFSFLNGFAMLPPDAIVSQASRQHGFETYKTTDDHCMAIVGIARDAQGKSYFIMKNSWGTDNPFQGLMYMSEDYFRQKTIALFMSKAALTDQPF